jgi:anti-sigma regulatory factor (Ser/Thr protein kinase)
MDRLRRATALHEGSDVAELCEQVVSSLIDVDHVADDIAVVAMRPLHDVSETFSLTLPAEPRMLVELRRPLRQWLRSSGVTPDEESDILVACGEACANAVRHAYPAEPGEMVLGASIVDGLLTVTVHDHGTWRAPADRGGGWGLHLIDGLMDSSAVDHRADGTTVTMRRALATGRNLR